MKIPQMPYVIINFLLEVDDLVSWIVDEVTVTVKKVEAKVLKLFEMF